MTSRWRNIAKTVTSLRSTWMRSEQKQTDGKDRYRSQFRYGSFTRSLQLLTGVEESDLKASYRGGILEVHVPIDTRKAESRKIAIAH